MQAQQLWVVDKSDKKHQIWKYVLDSEGKENVWCHGWDGRHVIGYDCEWLDEYAPLSQLEELKRWKAEALSVMPDMQAIGKAIGVPLGQSIHDKILPAIQQLSKEQQQREYSTEDIIKFMQWLWDSEDFQNCGYANSTMIKMWLIRYNNLPK